MATYLQNILNFQELSANKALGTLSNQDIVEIEQQMRNAAPRIAKLIRNSDGLMTMLDYYGSFYDDSEHFTFSVGDIRVLQTIINTVKQKGIHQFIFEKVPDAIANQNSIDATSEMHSEWMTLKARIKNHFPHE